MFKYFPDSAVLSQAVSMAFNLGGDVNEIDRACKVVRVSGGVADADSWYSGWVGVAQLLLGQAHADEELGRRISAAHKYRRASAYYMMAERMIPHTDARKAECYAALQDAMWRYIALTGEPAERVEVPYLDQSLPGIFIPAARSGPAPTVLFIDGFDAYKELIYLRKNSRAARHRGMAMLIVNTPGIGEALRLRGMTTRHDTEIPVGACIDWLERRADVDASRVGIIGLSLGGYYAPRAAAFEKRIKACVAWGAQWDVGARWNARYAKGDKSTYSAPDTQIFWVTGKKTLEDALAFMQDFTLKDVVGRIEVPFLILHGERDHLVSLEEARKTHAGAVKSPRAELLVTTAEHGGEGHCSMDNMQTGVDLIYDWMADILGGDNSGAAAVPGEPR